MRPCRPGTAEIVSDVSSYMTTHNLGTPLLIIHHILDSATYIVGCPTEQPYLQEDLREPRMPMAYESLCQSIAVPLCAIPKLGSASRLRSYSSIASDI